MKQGKEAFKKKYITAGGKLGDQFTCSRKFFKGFHLLVLICIKSGIQV